MWPTVNRFLDHYQDFSRTRTQVLSVLNFELRFGMWSLYFLSIVTTHLCDMSILNKIDKNCSCKHDIQQSEQTLLSVFLKSRKFYFPFLICSITFKIQIVGGNYTQKSGVHIPTPGSHFFVFFSFNFQILLKNLNLFCLTTFDYLFFQKLNKTC